MLGLTPTWTTIVPLTIAVVAMLATLTLSLPAALIDGRMLNQARKRGRHIDSRDDDVVRAGQRREVLRLAKLTLLNIGIALSFTRIANIMEWRNAIFAALAMLMLTNSILDYLTRRRAIRGRGLLHYTTP